MVNRLTLVGRSGDDPAVHIFENGNKVAKFSLATSEKYKNMEGEKVEETTWHNIVIYGKLADVVESWVHKGDLLFLEGKVKTRSYEDKEGNKKYITEVICDTMQMLSSKGETLKKDEEIKADPLNLEPPLPGPGSIVGKASGFDDIPFGDPPY